MTNKAAIEKTLAERVIAALAAVLPTETVGLDGDRIDPEDGALKAMETRKVANVYVRVEPFAFASAEKWRAGSCEVSLEATVRADEDDTGTLACDLEAEIESLLFGWRFYPDGLESALGGADFSTAYIDLTGGESPSCDVAGTAWKFSRTFTLHGIVNI